VTQSPLITVALPASVRADTGLGGLPRVVVSGPAASAEIYLQGAHLSSWTPTGQQPVVWMSEESVFAPGAPLRGGVPVCFPWFGPHPSGSGPLHGFARILPWSLVGIAERGDDVMLTFRLVDGDVTRDSVWPHPFEALYQVTVGATLELRLEVINVGAGPITFEEAFHTYLAVRSIGEAMITGIEASAYTERVPSERARPASGEPLTISGETDRIYAQPGTIAVHDHAGARTLEVRATGSAKAVVWNPWIAKSAAMADFGDDEWTGMVCIETCNVREAAVTLEAGERSVMTAAISVAPG
jgi:glucose-6-phosphate 1-epimerase